MSKGQLLTGTAFTVVRTRIFFGISLLICAMTDIYLFIPGVKLFIYNGICQAWVRHLGVDQPATEIYRREAAVF